MKSFAKPQCGLKPLSKHEDQPAAGEITLKTANGTLVTIPIFK